MYTYTFIQWLMFLYIYCFLGWCFETTYVSLKEKRFVNRGFMKGPFLTIYGFGAITVLWSALPFRNNPVAVYFVGALAATLLEYITGVCMEALFKVRYWDYSDKRFQLHGHICLGSTITWGFISLGMIYIFHEPIERFLFLFPNELIINTTFILTIIIVADFATSFKTAMDIRQVLAKMAALKEETKHLQNRIIELEQIVILKVVETKDKQAQRLDELLSDIKDRLEHLQLPEFTELFQQYKEELFDIRSSYIQAKEKIKASFTRDNLKMLRRNPSASSDKYKELLDEYKIKLEQKVSEEKKKND